MDSEVSKSTYTYRESSDLDYHVCNKEQRRDLEIEQRSHAFKAERFATIRISFCGDIFVASAYNARAFHGKRERDATCETVHRFQGPLRALPPEDFNFFLSGVQGEPVRGKNSRVLRPRRLTPDGKYTDPLTHREFPALACNCCSCP